MIEKLKNYCIFLERMAVFLAQVVTIVGIGIGFWYYLKGQEAERRQIAIEAINQIRSKEGVDALRRLKDGHGITGLDYPTATADMDYVIAWYDHIAMLYVNNLADHCLVKRSLFKSAETVAEILNSMRYPEDSRRNFDLLRERMKDDAACEP